ncbi:MAG TPA: polysaccharide biosynthesis tyrosine autokinase [Chitinophagaceae bacterium]|nr:polysaccharide biosynthesis tyrosine autokinase [Chitinophagaceae bacterium]
MEEFKSGTNAKQELFTLSIRDIFYKYIRFLPLFVLSVALALLGAFIYLRYATNIYGATGTMLINATTGKNNSSSGDRVEDILTGGARQQSLQNEIEMLKSRPLMKRVVENLKLQFSYTIQGRVKDKNIYAISPFYFEFTEQQNFKPFSLEVTAVDERRFKLGNGVYELGQLIKDRNGVFRLVQTGAMSPGSVYLIEWEPAESVAASMINLLKVQNKTPGTGILNLSMETTSPQLSADIVNKLMAQYDSMTVEKNNYSADQMINFINGRLVKLKLEIDSLQQIELDLRQKANLFDVDIQSSNYLANVSDVNKAINEQELRVNTTENIAAYIQDKENQYNRVVPSSLGLEDITLNELVSAYNKAQVERQILLNSNIPPNNPSVKETEKIIEKQRQSLLENLKNIKQGYYGNIAKLRNNVDRQQGELKTLPSKIKELLEIQRQISTKLTLYSLLEGKGEETAIGRASTISNSTVIDMAQISTVPIKPQPQFIQILAIAAGLLIPILVVFVIELLNDKVTTRMDVEKVTQVPIVGEVGHSYSEKVLVVNKTSRGMVAEQFRIIRSNLQYIIHNVQRPIILVTSSFSGEGKSFVSTNMAAVMALTGKKTILLEFDIRKPKILSGLNIGKKPGISNFLLGTSELKDLIIPVQDQENLFILPCGPIPPNPAELLLDPKMDEMFDWLRNNFEVVVVDTAPVGMVSDAMTLAKFADCSLYLVRQGHTFKKQIALIDELYQSKKLPKISIIVNDVKMKVGYGYYGYGRYGYGYGYNERGGGYYDEEEENNSRFSRIIAKLNPANWFKK